MKKLIYLVLTLSLLLPIRSHAFELEILTEQYAPFNYKKDNDNKIRGFIVEIVEAILKETGNEHLKIKMYPWPRAYRIIQKKPNVMLFTMTKSKKREKLFKWAGPVAERIQCMWKLKRRTDIKIKTLEDAKNYTITMVPDSSMHQYLSSRGFTEKQFRFIHSGALSIKKFIAGRDDLHFDLKMALAYRLKQIGESMDLVELILSLPSTGNYYLAFSLGTPDSTVNQFQETLDKLKANGTFDRIKNKYIK
ncbi:MAG: ABC transporter substrate-binding protein [Deltaproteobacteria bacterium]|nr:ABC transporter substrate-binding protein [Deltaproteobacteria bacterium]